MAKGKLTKAQKRAERIEHARLVRIARRRASASDPITFLQAFRAGLLLFGLLAVPLAVAVTYLSPLTTTLDVYKGMGLVYGLGFGLLAAVILAALFALRAVRTDAESREATGG